MIGVGLLLILLAVVVLVAASQMKTAAKSAIEHSLSLAFLTDVTVEDVDIAPRDGHLEVHNLKVGNPASFRSGTAMELEVVVVDVDLSTVFSENPTITRVVIKRPHVNLRHELAQGTNLTMLAKHASRFSKAGETVEAAAPEADPDAPTRQFIIKELRCEGATVDMSTNIIPRSGLNVDVAPFTLTDISNDRPITPAEVSAVFIRTLIRQTLSTKGLLKPVADLLRGEADEVGSNVEVIQEPEPELAE